MISTSVQYCASAEVRGIPSIQASPFARPTKCGSLHVPDPIKPKRTYINNAHLVLESLQEWLACISTPKPKKVRSAVNVNGGRGRRGYESEEAYAGDVLAAAGTGMVRPKRANAKANPRTQQKDQPKPLPGRAGKRAHAERRAMKKPRKLREGRAS
jgi:hypothetical protein